MLSTYEVQTKVDGKWTHHSTIEGNEPAALNAWRYVAGMLTEPARLITLDYKGRIRVMRRQAARTGFRVTYGETAPVWSRIWPTRAEAEAFAARHRGFGDIVFGIERVG